MNAHVDVAAYALGAMDDREASQFEDHLVGCATCTAELESMVSVVALLADVTLEDVTGEAPVGPYTAATGIPVGGQPPVQPQAPRVPQMPSAPQMPQAPPVPPMPQRPGLTPVAAAGGPGEPFGEPPETYGDPYGDPYGGPMLVPGSEDRREDRPRREERRDDRRAAASSPSTGPTSISRRRQARPRRTVLLAGVAAAASVLGAVGGGAVVARTGYFQEQSQVPRAQADGIVGPGQTGGETFSNTDKKTGAHVDAQLVSRPWGTNVAFTVTKIKGPKTCRLVAVRPDGENEVLSTWTVPDGGYGFAERPQPLQLVAATSLQADEMTHLKVQEMEPNGDASTLVTVRV